MPLTHNDCLPLNGTPVKVLIPFDTTGLASARTPVKLVLSLIAAAKAMALEPGSLLETTVLEKRSSSGVLGRILTPLIIRSSMPKFLTSATALGVISFAATPINVALALLVVVMVYDTPGVFAVSRISPTLLPAVAMTPRFLFVLIFVIKSSRTACGVKDGAVVVNVVPLMTIDAVSVAPTVPVNSTLVTCATAGPTAARVAVFNTDSFLE